jgi:hypothetical protein
LFEPYGNTTNGKTSTSWILPKNQHPPGPELGHEAEGLGVDLLAAATGFLQEFGMSCGELTPAAPDLQNVICIRPGGRDDDVT